MQRHKKRGAGDRSFQPGKGSAERSSEWRKYYDDVVWPDGGQGSSDADGFERRGNKLTKRYGTAGI